MPADLAALPKDLPNSAVDPAAAAALEAASDLTVARDPCPSPLPSAAAAPASSPVEMARAVSRRRGASRMHLVQKRDGSRTAPGKTYCPLAQASLLVLVTALVVVLEHDSALPMDLLNSTPVKPWRYMPSDTLLTACS